MSPSLSLSAFLAGSGLLLAPPQGAGERLPLEPSSPSTAVAPRELVAGGEVSTFPYEPASDEAPLPVQRQGAVGGASDRWIAEPSGDPRFLSFAAGAFQPPLGERMDPELLAPAAYLHSDERPRPETYAFVLFEKRIRPERLAELEALGARVLGFHPHYAVRIAAERDAMALVANLPYVGWVGGPREWQKLHPVLQERMQGLALDEEIALWVSTYEPDSGGDPSSQPVGSLSLAERGGLVVPVQDQSQLPRVWRSNGWQERRLEALGFSVKEYAARVAAFRGRLRLRDLERLLREDYVQFVELDLPPHPMHDESMPLIDADLTRATWTGGTSSAVVAGIVDSGFDHDHLDLNHTYAVGWDMTDEGNPWFDGLGHGSHVGGTLCGNGNVIAGNRGGAPGLGWGNTGRLFAVKIFDQNEHWGSNASLLNILSATHSSYTDGGGNLTPRPHVINNSYGSGPAAWVGSEAVARVLDEDIMTYDQLRVYSIGNDGPGASTLSVEAATKNAFSVGNVIDYHGTDGYPGTITSSSSRGPAGDGRWKPNVVAPGRWITSVDAETGNGYSRGSGTSMAAPHVTAVAAQLCDRHSFLRYRPYTLGAVLMASALTKDDEVLSAPSTNSTSHWNVYGAGRVDGQRGMGSDSQQSLYFWAFTQDTSNYSQVELDVGAGATRLTVVMYYHEQAASAGAGSALVNDLDMWIDREPFANGGASGDWFAHQSPRDNIEIRMLENPGSGAYRIKVVPDSATSNSRVGICAIVSYGDTSPAVTMNVSADEEYVQPNDPVELTTNVFNAEHVASAIHLTTNLSGIPYGDSPESVIVTLQDGIQAELADNENDGEEVTLGNISHGRVRSVRFVKRWGSEGVKTFSVDVHGDNISNNGLSDDVLVTVDGTPPDGPTGLDSSTHQIGVPDCESSVQVHWDPATDALAGLDGYSYVWTPSPNSNPNLTIDLGANVTQVVTPLANGSWYFHIRAVDRSGNWGTTQHYGPIEVLASDYHVYCGTSINSTGFPATIGFQGSLSLQANDLVLLCHHLPQNQTAVFYYGPNEIQIPFGNGFRCVGGALKRFPIVTTGNGDLAYPVDNTNLPVGGDFVAGQAQKFQCWFRDPMGGGAAHNLSNGLSLQFCP